MNGKRMASIILAADGLGAAWCVMESVQAERSVNAFAGVGGREAYEAARLEHLIRLRDNAYVASADVRTREIDELERQIDDLMNGQAGVDELGDELRVKSQQ